MTNPEAVTRVDTVVIGAGQAGLATSRWLQKRDVPHTVLERGRVGETWRTQRWDSFRLNTPNVVNRLPDDEYTGGEPLGFASHDSLVSDFEEYRRRHALPVEEGTEVTAVRPSGKGLAVETSDSAWECSNVVLCSGDQNVPARPIVAADIPDRVEQLHAAEYRRPDRLPDGAVLVVGSGQSGVQIAEDLLEAGRSVYLATSPVGRMPRRYRGRDAVEWIRMTGLAEQRPEDLPDPAEVRSRQVLISGVRGGRTVSLQQLARDGVVLLGRLAGAADGALAFDGNLESNVAKGDEVSARLKGLIDQVIEKQGLDAPAAEPDPAEDPYPGLAAMAAVRELDLDEAGIRSIVWATGFRPRFDYLDPALLDENGRPRHTDGVGPIPGLFCVGLIWQRRRVSGLITGVDGDAQFVAERIAERRPG